LDEGWSPVSLVADSLGENCAIVVQESVFGVVDLEFAALFVV
jgi:hypothetical protein